MKLENLLANHHMNRQTNISPKIWVQPPAQQLRDIEANGVNLAPIQWVETETKKEN